MNITRLFVHFLFVSTPILAICQNIDSKSIAKANQIIKSTPVSVTDKTTTRSGNPHNYESLSIYWWPDPQNPRGPYVARDGEWNPEYKLYDFPRLQQLLDNLHNTSQAYLQTKEKKYYDYYCNQLDTWFINDDTYMLPNFDYCQFIPGKNNGKGNPQGLIDAYNFNQIIDEIEVVNSVSAIGSKRIKALKKWFYSFAQWTEKSPNGKYASKYKNNQAIAYETTLYHIYIFTSRPSKARKHALLCFQHIKEQIDDEGRQPQELRRAKPLFYSTYNMEHIDYFLSKVPTMVDEEVIIKVAKAKQYIDKLKKEQ